MSATGTSIYSEILQELLTETSIREYMVILSKCETIFCKEAIIIIMALIFKFFPFLLAAVYKIYVLYDVCCKYLQKRKCRKKIAMLYRKITPVVPPVIAVPPEDTST